MEKQIPFLKTLNISPISINRCWQGRRFKTKEYSEWREDVLNLFLPYKKIKWPDKCFFHLTLVFYIKNFLKSDIDNMIKPTQDAIVEARVIPDDRMIKKLTVQKIQVETKEEEKIGIFLTNLTNT